MTVDVVVIGAGHNGLVAAEQLARGGLSTVVMERRPGIGGAASNGLAHTIPPVHPALARAMSLAGLEWTKPDIALTAIGADGKAIPFYTDHRKTIEALSGISARDAERYGVAPRNARQATLPVSYFIDRDGVLRSKVIGPVYGDALPQKVAETEAAAGR